ncbi:hypothetical protein X839_04670 [Streptococcus thermophilus MTH17CL396]|nr:hypothetical protein X839_04670 [Streptococcus thermophilus MTH17CL396]
MPRARCSLSQTSHAKSRSSFNQGPSFGYSVYIDGDYSYYQPQLETFDELETPSSTGQILDEEKDIQMPDFVKKLIVKKGRENVKIPYLVKKMLEKKYGKNMISCYCLKVIWRA